MCWDTGSALPLLCYGRYGRHAMMMAADIAERWLVQCGRCDAVPIAVLRSIEPSCFFDGRDAGQSAVSW